MNTHKVAGIRRENRFSPNHVGNDAAIFSLTAEHLHHMGCTVNEYIESDLLVRDIDANIVFNMARERQMVRKLQRMEDEGCKVINSGYGIENCTREKMTRLLLSAGIAHPKSLILKTDDDPTEALEEAGLHHCWIKRGDFHAIHREDVTYVRHREEAKGIFHEFAVRGIETAVINEHLVGDLVKFYGVYGTDFFYWFYPFEMRHGKFGLEQINGAAKGFSFDLNYLRKMCDQAAQVLNVHIYGGDCIVSEDGTVRLIDFNDWPSFAPCRDEAAPHIAECIYRFMKQ